MSHYDVWCYAIYKENNEVCAFEILDRGKCFFNCLQDVGIKFGTKAFISYIRLSL